VLPFLLRLTRHLDALPTLDSARVWPDAILLWRGRLDFESDRVGIRVVDKEGTFGEVGERTWVVSRVSCGGIAVWDS
jgi:hypothetical protein